MEEAGGFEPPVRLSPDPLFSRQGPAPMGSALPYFGGPDPDRTDDILRARQMLSQLSYRPIIIGTHGGSRTPKILILSQTPMPIRLRGHLYSWYRHPASNRDAFQHRCLRPACLPIPAWRYTAAIKPCRLFPDCRNSKPQLHCPCRISLHPSTQDRHGLS